MYSGVVLLYLLTTRRVPGYRTEYAIKPGYPIRYAVGYPGNELPDNGSLASDYLTGAMLNYACEAGEAGKAGNGCSATLWRRRQLLW